MHKKRHLLGGRWRCVTQSGWRLGIGILAFDRLNEVVDERNKRSEEINPFLVGHCFLGHNSLFLLLNPSSGYEVHIRGRDRVRLCSADGQW